MFNARQLLDQVMGALPAQGGADALRRTVQGATSSGSGQLLTGAVAGGLVGLLAGNRRARRLVGKSAGTALTLGGLAAVAAIGYTAWQRHRDGSGPAQPLQLPPADSAFAPTHPGQETLARGLLVAMIQGAKADGHVDANEQARIFGQVEALALDSAAKAFVMDELAAPLDVGRIAAFATTPESAAELYSAALMAMDPDTDAERQFLLRLQGALRLDPGLAAQIEATVRSELQG